MKRFLNAIYLLLAWAIFSSAAAFADAPIVERQAAAPVEEEFVTARILSVSESRLDKTLLDKTGMVSNRQKVKLEVMEGPLKGQVFEVDNEITDNPAFNISVLPGKEVILSVVTGGGKTEVNIADHHRAPVLLWLFAAFIAVFLFFGGRKGVKSLAGLIVTVLLIAYVLLPLSQKGYNPLIVAIGICLTAGATSMTLVAGLSKKSLAAVIGTVGGVVIAGIAAQSVIVLAPLTGLSSEEAQILRGSLIHQDAAFYSGLLAAGMLIGALGVIMDVAISIASSTAEVAKAGRRLNRKELYQAGMNVGRDIMGTMTNTLVLAYAGGALPLLLLASEMPSTKLINLDLFATEIASALSGSLGLVFTIPLTAMASAILFSRVKDGTGFDSGDSKVDERLSEFVEGGR